MENRERDRVSQRTTPTEAGELNRKTEEARGRDHGSTVEFGQHIGQSENLEGGSTDTTRGDTPAGTSTGSEDKIGNSTEGRH